MNIYTLMEYLKACEKQYPERPAFIYRDFAEKKEIPFKQFLADYYRLTHAYRKLFPPKSHIAMIAENGYRFFLHQCAIISSGNVAVVLNQTHPLGQLAEFMQLAEVSEVVCDRDYMEELPVLYEGSYRTMEDVEVQMEEEVAAPEATDPDAPALILFSSGTSGKSKGVVLTNRNLITWPAYILEQGKASHHYTLMLLPMYHIGGVCLSYEALGRGEQLYFGSLKHLSRDLKQEQFDRIVAVPAMAERALNYADKSEAVMEHVRGVEEIFCVGAAFPSALLERLEALQVSPRMYYGLTETSGAVFGEGVYKKGACGRLFPFAEVMLRDGEILVKGSNVTVGYYGDLEKTRDAFDEGWFCTGDLGEIDEEGYLFIRGRKKNTIILSNGENVCPEELEDQLYRMPLVRECMVYGENEEICADIFVGSSYDEDVERQVQEYVRSINQKLPITHRIKRTHLVHQELPKNSMGKLIRRK